MSNDINERIKYYREQKNVKQKELCEAIGMKQNAYSQMERYGKRIPVERIKAIAKYLEIDPELILDGEKSSYDLTPAVPKPIHINDPGKDNPFFVPLEPEVSIGYKNGEIALSIMEGQILNLFRNLSAEKKNEFLDYLNKLGND